MGDVSGLVRMGDDLAVVISHLEPGDVAVIDQPDLDAASAAELVEAAPSAVLNAASTVTGRYPTRGAGVLIEAGIPLVDQLGTPLLGLQEGQRVSVRGGDVFLADRLVASGSRVTAESNAQALAGAKLGMSDQLQSFAVNTSEFLRAEQSLLTEGIGLKDLGLDFGGRPVVVVGPGQAAAQQLRDLYRFIADRNAAVIAVGLGAKAVLDLKLHPDVVTGNVRAVPERALTRAGAIVLHSPRLVASKDPRLDSMGLSYHNVASSLSDTDLACVMAYHCGAGAIIPLGSGDSLEEFFDLGRIKMSSAFFTQLVTRGRLISPQAVLLAYSRPLRASYIWLLLLAGLLAVGAAVRLTPFGRSLWLLLPVWGQWAVLGGAALCLIALLVAFIGSMFRSKR